MKRGGNHPAAASCGNLPGQFYLALGPDAVHLRSRSDLLSVSLFFLFLGRQDRPRPSDEIPSTRTFTNTTENTPGHRLPQRYPRCVSQHKRAWRSSPWPPAPPPSPPPRTSPATALTARSTRTTSSAQTRTHAATPRRHAQTRSSARTQTRRRTCSFAGRVFTCPTSPTSAAASALKVSCTVFLSRFQNA